MTHRCHRCCCWPEVEGAHPCCCCWPEVESAHPCYCCYLAEAVHPCCCHCCCCCCYSAHPCCCYCCYLAHPCCSCCCCCCCYLAHPCCCCCWVQRPPAAEGAARGGCCHRGRPRPPRPFCLSTHAPLTRLPASMLKPPLTSMLKPPPPLHMLLPGAQTPLPLCMAL